MRPKSLVEVTAHFRASAREEVSARSGEDHTATASADTWADDPAAPCDKETDIHGRGDPLPDRTASTDLC
jgi:hypothetical protein